MILGLPGETPETLQETDVFLEEMQLDDVDIKIFQPYPGSPIWENRSSYDVEWSEMDFEDMFYKGRPGDYHGNVRTSALTTEEIYHAQLAMERKHKRWT